MTGGVRHRKRPAAAVRLCGDPQSTYDFVRGQYPASIRQDRLILSIEGLWWALLGGPRWQLPGSCSRPASRTAIRRSRTAAPVSTRWRSAVTTRIGGEISNCCKSSTSATCATVRRSTGSGSATAGMTGAFRMRRSACSRPSTSSPLWICATSGYLTGSATSRTPTSRPCSPSTPAPLHSGFRGCNSIRP